MKKPSFEKGFWMCVNGLILYAYKNFFLYSEGVMS